MTLPDPEVIELEACGIDAAVASAPAAPAVFLLWPREGAPYLSRTASLRRRLTRLLGAGAPSRMLNLRAVARRIEYWRTASRLEAALYGYALARRHFPETYCSLLRLRMPYYVKLILSNRFPRTQITARLTASRALYYGPMPSRAAAERFESEFLDLFQLRRCQEDLEPSPEHPGCIYGEMNRCLRPCQLVVSADEYRSEAHRVAEFLSSRGTSLLRTIAAARDRLSEELDFEEAARQHARWERVNQIIRLAGDLAAEIDRLHGAAVTPSANPGEVLLWFLRRGAWQGPVRFSLAPVEGKPVSLDKRLREILASLEPVQMAASERQEHLALLARWYYSSWRDGEWIAIENFEAPPLRKLVHAIHRVAAGASA
jgi:excinuclease UvrABC nuclease subunit